MDKIGLVQVYTGDGKGKTTAAFGLALRALGRGWRVAFFQFLKGGGQTGEVAAAAKLGSDLTMIQCGTGELIVDRPPTPQEIRQARRGMAAANAMLAAGRVDLVVLDEIAAAVNLGLLEEASVASSVAHRAPGVEVVLTGREMPAALLAQADLISEIKAVKHPYTQGIGAREGIEF